MKEQTPRVISRVLTKKTLNVKSNNFLKAYQRHNLVYRITIAGIFFALVLLMQYFEKFMPFANTYLKLNFTLIFILPVFYLAGPYLGFTVLILRLIFGPLLGTFGYDLIGIITHLILFFSTLIILMIYFINIKLWKKIKNWKYQYLVITISTSLITSIILAGLNGYLFTPLFWWAFKYLPTANYQAAQELYVNNLFIQVAHFGIKNYWAGIFAVYLAGNMVKFSLVFLVNYPLHKIILQFLSLK